MTFDNDDYFDGYGVLFSRPCETRGCENEVDCADPSVFCSECRHAIEPSIERQQQAKLSHREPAA